MRFLKGIFGWSVISAATLVVSVGCVKKSVETKAASAPVDALKKIQEDVQKSPSYDNFVALGLELGKRQMNQEAIVAYKKAADVNPKAPLAWNNICSELNNLKHYSEAVGYCEKALAADGNFVLAKNNLAFANSKIAESKVELLKRKSEVVANKSRVAKDLLDLGMELYNVRELAAANELWALIKKGDPLYAKAKNNEASAYILMNQLPAAEKALNEALSLEPQNQLFLNNKKWLEDKKLGH